MKDDQATSVLECHDWHARSDRGEFDRRDEIDQPVVETLGAILAGSSCHVLGVKGNGFVFSRLRGGF